MIFEWIEGLGWGWLIFAHVLAILLIWVPLAWDPVIDFIVKPLLKLVASDNDGSRSSG